MKKEDIIRHYKWHKKRSDSLQHGFMRFSPLEDCAQKFHQAACIHNGKHTHYHCLQVRVIGYLYSTLLWDEPIARDAEIWLLIARGLHSFTCHPHTNHTCLYSSSRKGSPPFGCIHCACPLRDGQAEFTWVTGYILM